MRDSIDLASIRARAEERELLSLVLSAEQFAFFRHFGTGLLGLPDDLVRQMALANDSLPPDSPHKITRADVKAIAVRAEAFPELGPIAAKLAALLPPK